VDALGEPVPLRVDGVRLRRRPREMPHWFPLESLRRALGRDRGVRWRTVPLPPLTACADATWIEASLVTDRLSGWKPSLTPLLLRALAAGLRAFPRANACFGATRAHAPLSRQVHLGVALYTERGLRIPVLRHADR
jgi:pyruvate dehydrogenase E2 component (dihydrolipoamide acetyltransferase)